MRTPIPLTKLVDQLLGQYPEPGDLTGEDGLLSHLTKRLVERTMSDELDDHVGYEKGARLGSGGCNSPHWHDPEATAEPR